MPTVAKHSGLQRGPSRWAFAGLLLLIVWLPIPWGSHRLWATSAFELALCVLWVAWAVSRAAGRAAIPERLASVWPLHAVWLLWLLWLCLQSLPLPVDWLAQYAPANVQSYRDAYELLGAPLPARLPVTLAADISLQQLQLSFAYFAFYVLVLMTATSRKRLRILAWCIVLSGLAQAMYGGFMSLSGMEYGFLAKKEHYLGDATGSFVNRNHLAGYLEICLATGIGLLLSHLKSEPDDQTWRQRLRSAIKLLASEKIRLRVFLAVMVLGLILTRSRMGNFSFYASLTVCGLIYVFLRERRILGKSLILFGSLILVDMWLLGSQVGLAKLTERVANTQMETEIRVPLFRDYLPLVKTYQLTGAGLGAFPMVYPAFKSPEIAFYIDYAHNDYAQVLIEAGYPGALLLGLLALMTCWHALRVVGRRRDRQVNGVAFGGLMAVVAIALHSTTDFNLQIPANAATLVVVMAMIAACSAKSRTAVRSPALIADPSAGSLTGSH